MSAAENMTNQSRQSATAALHSDSDQSPPHIFNMQQATHSCHFCYVQEIDPGIRRRGFDLSSGSIVKYRGSRVLDGALNGCAFFKDIFSSLECVLRARRHGEDSNPPNFHPENWIYELVLGDYNGHLETASGTWRCAKGELPGDMQYPQQDIASYIVLAHEGDPASESVPIRPFMHDYEEEKSILWTKRRISDCELNHRDCSKPTRPYLPARLLRIGESSDGNGLFLWLHLTSSSEGVTSTEKYTTLSYCWGGSQEFQLNTHSEEKLLCGIQASTLPRTLYDAVKVTWELGIKYIWIDSLCIRQDDQKDKAVEVAQMHWIYGNSFITISAKRASQCRQGFLHQVSLPAPSTVAYKLPFASPSGRLGSVVLSKGSWTSPIDYRGWTLQEHLLARRILSFTDFQLHWTCGGISMFEKEEKETLPSRHVDNLTRAYGMYRSLREDNQNCKHWMNIVEEYARRDLTDGSDRLPAMSGIAEYWAGISRDVYLAGLWKSHMPLGLLWTSAQPFRQDEFRAYRAPSWSWASLVGQVDWFNHLFTGVDPTLEVKSCMVTPVHSKAPFGAVQSGCLVIHGLLQETVMDEAPAAAALAIARGNYLSLGLADVHLDYWDELLECKVKNARVYCLQICSFDAITGTGPSGLILATEDNELFTRVGFFVFEPPQQHEVEENPNFEALLELSEVRRLVQNAAFQDGIPRDITII